MENNAPQRPRKRVSRKVLRRRQMTALAVIALLVLLLVILIAKGCSKDDNSGGEAAGTTTTTSTTTTVEITPAETQTTAKAEETTTTSVENPAASQVQLSKREMYLDVGGTDVSIISAYPSGSSEANEVWKSSNEKIATVNSMGYVTAVSPGECYIILSFDNNPGVEIEIKVSVADSGAPLTAGSGAENSSDDTSTTVAEDADTEGVSAPAIAEGGVVGLNN